MSVKIIINDIGYRNSVWYYYTDENSNTLPIYHLLYLKTVKIYVSIIYIFTFELIIMKKNIANTT